MHTLQRQDIELRKLRSHGMQRLGADLRRLQAKPRLAISHKSMQREARGKTRGNSVTERTPDIQSSFEFRGETIYADWYDVQDSNELPDVDWQQVYAVGNINGKVPVVHYADSEARNLPGGKFDELGDTIERVLRREMQEELNMRVLSWRPIGYQFLRNQKYGNVYQLRVYAELESIGEFVNDPGGKVVGHSLVPIEELNAFINYGKVGERIMALVLENY